MDTAKQDLEEKEVEFSQRNSIVELKRRGRMKVLKPINGFEPSLPGKVCTLSSRLSEPEYRSQGSHENQASRLRFSAPSTTMFKENEMSHKPHISPSETVFPPSKSTFQAFSEEEISKNPSEVSCQTKTSVDIALSAVKPAATRQDNPEGRVQSMYRKELLTNNGTELSLEELRAEQQNLKEKYTHLRQMKEGLKQQIEEKLKFIQERDSDLQRQEPAVDNHLSHQKTERRGGATVPLETSVSFKSKSEATFASNSATSQTDSIDAGVSAPKQPRMDLSKPFTIFDENSQMREQPSSLLPVVASTKHKSLKLPAPILKARRSQVDFSSNKDASVSRTEEIINGHANKTLCRSPEDTCDFVRAAQLASTPSSLALGKRGSTVNEAGLTVDLGTLTKTASVIPEEPSSEFVTETKKLSPILEISQEWGSNSVITTQGLEFHSGGKSIHPSARTEAPPPQSVPVAELSPDDPCDQDVRRRLLEKVDLTSYSNFHKKTGPLPTANENNDLCLDGETLIFLKEMDNLENYSYYASNSGTMIVKESSALPWDFYIASQLRARQPCDQPPQCSCFLFDNGSITVWRVPVGQTLEELISRPIDHRGVLYVVTGVLEMVRQMHSCRLVHGALRPNTLILQPSFDDKDGVVTAIDFSGSLDLDLQADVTSVQALSSARDYVSQGLLSPSASPYQLDLLGVAEIAHMLLVRKRMEVERENSEWKLTVDLQTDTRGPMNTLWGEFFHKILNPGDKSTESILSDLLSDLGQAVSSGVDPVLFL